MLTKKLNQLSIKIAYFKEDREHIGEVFQDEENMAALLLYKHGEEDQYHMVRFLQHISYQSLQIIIRTRFQKIFFSLQPVQHLVGDNGRHFEMARSLPAQVFCNICPLFRSYL